MAIDGLPRAEALSVIFNSGLDICKSRVWLN